jgi:threonine synthase
MQVDLAAASTLEWLECSRCRKATRVDGLRAGCEACGGVLLARYRLDEAARTLTREALRDRPATLWRYAEVLPGANAIVSLGEGMTPLHRAEFLGRSLGIERLFIKDESINPTGSFKARGMSVAITMAREGGARRVALPSAGNAGSAAAAYGAAAGLAVDVFLPADTPESFRKEAAAYGATVHLVPGDISDCGQFVRESRDADQWFDLATLREPYRLEGKKTMGYELAEQLAWELPDVIIYPTGGGTGLIGVWKAFEELEQLGLLLSARRPRLVAVQAEGCAPIVEAFSHGAHVSRPWPKPRTRACGLRVPRVHGDRLVLQALRESEGTALTVTDDEMSAAQLEMARGEGIFPAPEGGATLAAARRLVDCGVIDRSDRVVLFATGTGLKYRQSGGLRVRA